MSSHDWIIKTLHSFAYLVCLVSAGAFVGGLAEARGWTRYIAFFAAPFAKFARLPGLCAGAFVTAIANNNAANSILAGAFDSGKLARRQMMLAAMVNSYLAKISHSVRIMPVVIPATGLGGIIYYAVDFFCGLVRTILLALVMRTKDVEEKELSASTSDTLPGKITPWGQSLKTALASCRKVLPRIFLVSAPLYFLVAYLGHAGFFKRAEKWLPGFVGDYFSPEILAVAFARMGSMTGAASVAQNLYVNGEITAIGIAIAFLLGNLVSNPVRSVRRNLPSTAGIFPGRDGVWIVLTLQSLRFVFALAALAILVACQA